VNVIFVLEGEEEIYSPHLKQFVDEYYEELNEADAVYSPGSYRQLPSGLLIIHPGYNGFVELELEVKGGAWGGTTDQRAVWSGYAPFVDPPLLRLQHAMTTMFGPDGKVLVDGFYDNWAPPTPEERRELEKSKERLGDSTILQDLASVKRFRGGRSVEELFEECITVPQLFPVGVQSGYIPLSYIPMEAKAKLQCRFGPNLSSEEILQKIRGHLDNHGFPEIEIHCTNRFEWARSSISEDVVRALIRMAEIHGVDYVVWPTSPAVLSLDLFNRSPLNKPIVCGALGHGGRLHIANEYITVEGIREQMKGTVTFLHEYANI